MERWLILWENVLQVIGLIALIIVFIGLCTFVKYWWDDRKFRKEAKKREKERQYQLLGDLQNFYYRVGLLEDRHQRAIDRIAALEKIATHAPKSEFAWSKKLDEFEKKLLLFEMTR